MQLDLMKRVSPVKVEKHLELTNFCQLMLHMRDWIMTSRDVVIDLGIVATEADERLGRLRSNDKTRSNIRLGIAVEISLSSLELSLGVVEEAGIDWASTGLDVGRQQLLAPVKLQRR